MNSKKTEKQPLTDKKIAETLYDYIEGFVISICLVFLVFTFLFRVSVVSGSSMEKTLSHKDVLLVSSLPYTPEQGDIVVFRAPYSKSYPNEHLVKRVIATGGQTIDIDFENWKVTVDGKVIDESEYLFLYGFRQTSNLSYPLTVPEGEVFVMGDNRYNSHDSRVSDIGTVDEDYIIGPVLMRLMPFGKIGFVN